MHLFHSYGLWTIVFISLNYSTVVMCFQGLSTIGGTRAFVLPHVLFFSQMAPHVKNVCDSLVKRFGESVSSDKSVNVLE